MKVIPARFELKLKLNATFGCFGFIPKNSGSVFEMSFSLNQNKFC
jgi:hypothetical protein